MENSNRSLKSGSGAAFMVEVKDKEKLVIVQEVERSYLRKLDIDKVVGNISQAVNAQHGLQVYAAVLVKTGSIPKTSSGKIQRHACKNAFINGSLNVLQDWSEDPWQKANFRYLHYRLMSNLCLRKYKLVNSN
ncbi:MAG: hypothetical protein AAF630_03815 [Cyanobacteria bacterium P01_C01_bin.38]